MNTLKVARQLQEAGCEAKLAEVISLSIEEAVDTKAATKSDLNEVKTILKADLNEAKTVLRADLSEVKNELKNDIHQLENKLIDRIGSLQTHMIYWGFALLGLFITYLEIRWK